MMRSREERSERYEKIFFSSYFSDREKKERPAAETDCEKRPDSE